MNSSGKSVTIIVPVYGDWGSLRDCVLSLINNVSAENKVIFANDRGPEHDKIEKKLLALIKNRPNFYYFANEQNMGFLQNCNNAAFVYDTSDNDIVLLNSDTRTTPGFIEELQGVAESSEIIATVCPRSNDATIASIPQRSRNGGQSDEAHSYEVFKSVSSKMPRFTISPVSVGFCMYIKRSVIRQYGLFDEVYKKGYGEEDDFCMRMNRKGYISVVANHAFVFHKGAMSFTAEKRSELIKENAKVLVSRFPYFPDLVRNFQEYPVSYVEHFADTIEAIKSKKTAKLLIDLHSLPAVHTEHVDEVRRLLGTLKVKELIGSITVVTSDATRRYLQIENTDIKWVEPHRLSEQYDVSYSLLPLYNLNNARMLRDAAYMHVFHERCVADMYLNEKKSDQKLQRAKEIYIGRADGIVYDAGAVEEVLLRTRRNNVAESHLQQRWSLGNVLFSENKTLAEEKKINKTQFIYRYYSAFRKIVS